MNQKLYSFAPLVTKDTYFLVVGTMPGKVSLQRTEYYAFKQNSFWLIIFRLAGQKADTYEEKIKLLQNLKIGLWDNLKVCERNSSLDSDIKSEEPNDFENLLCQYKNIKKLLFNGQKSFYFFKKYHSELLKKYNYAVLPSTSPANARLSFEKKFEQWQKEFNKT